MSRSQLTTMEWLTVIGALVGMAVGSILWANSTFAMKEVTQRQGTRIRGLEAGVTELRVNMKFFMERKGVKYQEVAIPNE